MLCRQVEFMPLCSVRQPFFSKFFCTKFGQTNARLSNHGAGANVSDYQHKQTV